jgi:pimeloyl-ACP methyl ester carboxylesterase
MKVLVSGQLIEYKDEGQGKIVLFLHGWGDQLSTFNGLAQQLSKKFRVIRFDFPGFGASSKPQEDNWTVGSYALLTAAFLEKLAIKDVYCVAGHSFGGRVIIKAIAEKLIVPEKVIFIAAAGIKPRKTVRKVGYYALAKIGKVVTFLPGMQRIRRTLREKLYAAAGATDYLRAEKMQTIFKNTVNEDLLPYIHLVRQPSLLIWGNNDDQTPVADAHAMANELHDARLFVVNDAAHFVHLDRPKFVQKRIDEFLK